MSPAETVIMPDPPTLADYQATSSLRAPPVQKPRVSIVTVCLNAAATIGRTIESVQSQAGVSIEHIVVDGGSTDGTVDLVRARARPEDVLVSEKDRGISDAFNKGAALAAGEFIQYLNADDWLSPDQIALAVGVLDANPDAGFVFGDLIFYENGEPSFHYAGDREYALKLGRRLPAMNHPTLLARRSVFERVGLFSLRYRCAMDYDWIYRVHDAGIRGLCEPRIVGHMTQEGISNRAFARTLDEVRMISVAHGRAPALARAEQLARLYKSRLSFLVRRYSDPLYRLVRRSVNRSYKPV